MSDEVDLIGLWEGERRLAIAMLDGFAVNAFETPPTPEDVAYWETLLAECEAKLAEVGNA